MVEEKDMENKITASNSHPKTESGSLEWKFSTSETIWIHPKAIKPVSKDTQTRTSREPLNSENILSKTTSLLQNALPKE